MSGNKRTGSGIKAVLLVGFLAALSGSTYFAYQITSEQESLDVVNAQLKQAISIANSLHSKQLSLQQKLGDTPVSELEPAEKAALKAIAFLKDRAALHGISIAGLKVGGASGATRRATDIRTSMTKIHDQDAGIRGIDVEIQATWRSLGDLDAYLTEFSGQPIILRDLSISKNGAVIKLRIIGV